MFSDSFVHSILEALRDYLEIPPAFAGGFSLYDSTRKNFYLRRFGGSSGIRKNFGKYCKNF